MRYTFLGSSRVQRNEDHVMLCFAEFQACSQKHVRDLYVGYQEQRWRDTNTPNRIAE